MLSYSPAKRPSRDVLQSRNERASQTGGVNRALKFRKTFNYFTAARRCFFFRSFLFQPSLAPRHPRRRKRKRTTPRPNTDRRHSPTRAHRQRNRRKCRRLAARATSTNPLPLRRRVDVVTACGLPRRRLSEYSHELPVAARPRPSRVVSTAATRSLRRPLRQPCLASYSVGSYRCGGMVFRRQPSDIPL